MSKCTHKPDQRSVPLQSPALAAFAAATAAKRAASQLTLSDFNASGLAHAAALGLAFSPCLLAASSVKPTVVSGKQARLNAAKRTEKRQQALAAGALDNKEIKASETEHPINKVKSNRKQNLQVAQTLFSRAFERNDVLHKTAHKLRMCSTSAAFRVISSDICHKTGQALCRSRVCPTCQRALSYKRRAAFLEFFDRNREVTKNYGFYHMVLTLRHSRDSDIRDGLYTKELMTLFKKLRGTHFDSAASSGLADEAKEYWNKRVAGGIYSVETVPGADGSPHIHLHVLLLAKMPLWRKSQPSEFLKTIRSRWLELSTDSTQVHLEPVYTWKLDEAGKPVLDAKGHKIKNYVTKQHSRISLSDGDEAAELSYQHLRAGVAECAKYTLKTDEASLSQFSDAFLYDLIGTRHRYYGRFGCLHKRSADSSQFVALDSLNADFKDLKKIEGDELRQLWNPATGEVVAKADTKLVVTSFRNVKPHTAPGSVKVGPDGTQAGFEHYYSIIDPFKVAEYDPYSVASVAKALSVTLYKRYKPENDIACEDESVSSVSQVQESNNNQSFTPLNTVSCSRFLPLPLNSFQYCWLVPIPQVADTMRRCEAFSVFSLFKRGNWPHIGKLTFPN